MSLLDTFYVEYKADTTDLDAKVDAVNKKSIKTTDDMKKQVQGSIKQMNELANKSKDGMNQAAASAERMGDAMKGVSSAVKDAGKGLGDLVQKIGGAAGGGFGGLGNIAGALKGLSAGPAALGAVAAGVAAAATMYGINAANQASARYGTIKKDAWGAGMSEKQLLMQQIGGTRLGITREQTLEGISGLHAKLQEVALYRSSPAAQGMQGDMNPLSRLLRKRGIAITSGGHFKDMDKIWDVIVEDLRKTSQRKGTNMALARATQQYGLNFEQADRIINASTADLKRMNHELEVSALKELEVAMKVRSLNAEKVKLSQTYTVFENQVAGKTVPALSRLIGKFTEATDNGNSLADAIGNIAAKCIDAVSYLVDKGKGLMHSIREADSTQTEAMAKSAFKTQFLGQKEQTLLPWLKQKLGMAPATTWDKLNPAQKEAAAEAAWQAQKAKDKAAQDKTEGDAKRKELAGVVKGYIGSTLKPNEINEGMAKAMKGGWSADTLDTYFKDLIENQKRGLKTADAQFQTSKEMQRTLSQFVSVGLEQAIAMWSAGVGRQGGLGGNGADQYGQARADFETRSRSIMHSPDRTLLALGQVTAANLARNNKYGTLGDAALPGDVDPHVNKRAMMRRANQIEADAAAMVQSNQAARRAQVLSDKTFAASQQQQANSIQVGQVIVQSNGDDPQAHGNAFLNFVQESYRKLASSHDGVFKR